MSARYRFHATTGYSCYHVGGLRSGRMRPDFPFLWRGNFVRRRRVTTFCIVALLAAPLSQVAMAADTNPAMTRSDYDRAMRAVAELSAEVKVLRSEMRTLQRPRSARSEYSSAAIRGTPSTAAGAPIPKDLAISPTLAVASVRPTSNERATDVYGPTPPELKFGGVKITPVGFLEAANIFRSRALANDIFSALGSIPFDSSKTGHEAEDRLSARQSRLGILLQSDIDSSTHLSGMFEIDFLGAAQTANSVEVNAFNPRARQLYASLDVDDVGWHFLAGQTWSLATLNNAGITPRDEMVPVTIDAQLVPGFVWTRQPQIRVAKDFDESFWIAVSLENPQTTFAGVVPANVISQIANGGGFYDGVSVATPPAAAGGGDPITPTTATSSLNHLPDALLKVAYDAKFGDRTMHLEALGLGRAFTDRIGKKSKTVYAGGVGVGVVANIVPGLLDLQASALTGNGIGRYGTSLLPDVTFDPAGGIKPLAETDFLAGILVHPSKSLDIYSYFGEENEERLYFPAGYGIGSPSLDVSGCFVEGRACPAVTRLVKQATIGFWRKFYEGPYGRVQLGVQYSFTARKAFEGLQGLTPTASDSMLFTSLRYYPF